VIKAVIFDLWETIGTKNIGISKTLREKFGIQKSPDFLQRYEQAIQLRKWKTLNDLAKSFLEEFEVQGTAENIEFTTQVMRQGIEKATLYDGMKELLEKLHRRYKLAILSNTTNFETEVLKRWDIEDIFDVIVFSWHIGSLKPAQENFKAVFSSLNVNAQDCLFIDDGDKNVLAAKSYGLQAIKYQNIEQLKQELKRLSINFN